MISYKSLADDQLISLLRSNDEQAFTEIYNRYWDKIFAVAYHRIGEETEAEGVVQEIFVSLWERRENLSIQYSLKTYLSVAAKYQVIMLLARRSRKQKYENLMRRVLSKETDAVSEWLSERELKRQIEKCIDQLPEKCKIVFTMSRKEGLSNVLIAEKLNISEKTVEGHITKALHLLRGALKLLLVLFIAVI